MNRVVLLEKPTPSISRLTLSEIQAKGLEHLLTKKKKFAPRKYVDPCFKVGRGSAHLARSVQDKTWYSVSYWHKKLEKEWHGLTANQRSHYSVELMKMLTSKLNSLPVDPLDSKLNASSALEMMKGLEAPTAPTVETPVTVDTTPAIAPAKE